jgi:hypothetical protein
MKTIVRIWIACLFVAPLFGEVPLGVDEITAHLKGVPAAELPAKAAELVKGSKRLDQTAMAKNVVKAAVKINPAATPLVIGAVAHAVPETAAVAAQAAAIDEPLETEEITMAAVAVVPTRAGEIVLAVCRAMPDDYRRIAIIAARTAPAAARDILNAVGAIRPDLKPYIDVEMAPPTRGIPSVTWCLDQAETARSRVDGQAAHRKDSGSGTDRGDAQSKSKPPHGNGNSPGGRNYARP